MIVHYIIRGCGRRVVNAKMQKFPDFSAENTSANGHDTNFGVTLVSRPCKFHVYKFAFAELNFVSLAEEINEIIQICETR